MAAGATLMGQGDNQQADHREAVRTRIAALLRRGVVNLMDILPESEGADPRLVAELMADLVGQGVSVQAPTAASFREADTTLPWKMPAADPDVAQWWFTLSSIDWLAERVRSRLVDPGAARVLAIGAPTVGYHLGLLGLQTTVLDVDEHVVEAISLESSSYQALQHDILDDFPNEYTAAFDAVVLDPPWYEPIASAFLRTALRALRLGGSGFCTLPPMLTRPGMASERDAYLARLAAFGGALGSLERGKLHYLVPRFEERAFASLSGFAGRPWRHSDLLEFRKITADESEPTEPVAKRKVQRYARKPNEFRAFQVSEQASAPPRTIVRAVDAYCTNVSRRASDGTPIDVWTSEKVGVQVENALEAKFILEGWADKRAKEQVASDLANSGLCPLESAQHVVEKYDLALNLWSRYAAGGIRRTDKEIQEAKQTVLSIWATPAQAREHQVGTSDGYRPDYQRDRDRVLWSVGLRRLANKTQLFPVDEDDQVRQRLAHSVEVLQLATTIADSFGLARDLVEAGALAHDVGHTPFGHAGEVALDKLLTRIEPRLPGFNHYEHGVDVVRYLEEPYFSQGPSGYPGLDLTPEVCECIFKHTFCHAGGGFSVERLRAQSKHGQFLQDGRCHLEGQAVRVADKVSYLVSDLEDGIRLGAIDETSLLRCRLFHRRPLDLTQPRGEPLLRRFLTQRRILIRVLMEDIIEATGRRLAQLGSPAGVRSAAHFMVDYSDELSADVSEVWRKLQVGLLHRDPRVLDANLRAARTVSRLLLLFAIFPDLVDPAFRKSHERLHTGPYLDFFRTRCKKVDVDADLLRFLPLELLIGGDAVAVSTGGSGRSLPVEQVVLATDYVAGLTDSQASRLYGRFLRSEP
jgi:dGTPase